MTGISFEIRLMDTGKLEGEIGASDLARICENLQELATRVGRWVSDSGTRGRLTRKSEQLTRVIITSLDRGSVCLGVSTQPGQSTLDGTTQDAAEVDRQFWQLVNCGSLGSLPPDAPQAVRESTLAMLKSMSNVAELVKITGKSSGLESSRVPFRPEDLIHNEWFTQVHDRQKLTAAVFSGILEAVDVRSSRFRIRDLAGNDLILTNVSRQYARLADCEVTATGEMSVNRNKRIMDAPTITPTNVPDWLKPDDQAEADFWSAVAASQPFDPDRWATLEPLTDEESDVFWDAINAQ